MSDVKITEDQVKDLIEASTIEDTQLGAKSTVVSVTLPNGFVVIESSSCVDPENYDHELGKKICLDRIKSKIWELEGYRLQASLNQ